MPPMSTFVGLEAKQAMEAAEAVLGEMLTPDTGQLFTVMSENIAKEIRSGNYPKLTLFVSMHQMNYPRVAEVVGVLLIAAMRNRQAQVGRVQ